MIPEKQLIVLGLAYLAMFVVVGLASWYGLRRLEPLDDEELK